MEGDTGNCWTLSRTWWLAEAAPTTDTTSILNPRVHSRFPEPVHTTLKQPIDSPWRLGFPMHSNLEQEVDAMPRGNSAGIRQPVPIELFPMGIAGLDDVLGGGLARNHLYLIEGDPGTGKTTIAMQFLMEGTRRGQKGLYVTLSESKAELLEIADS